jgi:hypothetical protein
VTTASTVRGPLGLLALGLGVGDADRVGLAAGDEEAGAGDVDEGLVLGDVGIDADDAGCVAAVGAVAPEQPASSSAEAATAAPPSRPARPLRARLTPPL